ncbi:hypothetical protein BDZ89DRAFT_1036624 [Hymenopellis radicata]|nr:hypothetical protein BDZ89DRAFT_1036624 [Hymenopellis radicata]
MDYDKRLFGDVDELGRRRDNAGTVPHTDAIQAGKPVATNTVNDPDVLNAYLSLCSLTTTCCFLLAERKQISSSMSCLQRSSCVGCYNNTSKERLRSAEPLLVTQASVSAIPNPLRNESLSGRPPPVMVQYLRRQFCGNPHSVPLALSPQVHAAVWTWTTPGKETATFTLTLTSSGSRVNDCKEKAMVVLHVGHERGRWLESLSLKVENVLTGNSTQKRARMVTGQEAYGIHTARGRIVLRLRHEKEKKERMRIDDRGRRTLRRVGGHSLSVAKSSADSREDTCSPRVTCGIPLSHGPTGEGLPLRRQAHSSISAQPTTPAYPSYEERYSDGHRH